MEHRATGWQRFAEADWAAARAEFAAALTDDPGDPEALDGLGQSLSPGATRSIAPPIHAVMTWDSGVAPRRSRRAARR